MARAAKSKKRSSPAPQTIHKARGVISPRVQRGGPEHFGIVCVDCAKARSKWMLTDFYGRILVPPTEVEHTQACFASMIERLRTDEGKIWGTGLHISQNISLALLVTAIGLWICILRQPAKLAFSP